MKRVERGPGKANVAPCFTLLDMDGKPGTMRVQRQGGYGQGYGDVVRITRNLEAPMGWTEGVYYSTTFLKLQSQGGTSDAIPVGLG
jgi:hypothetical protein